MYRAKDTKLGREVAIKVLPEDFAANDDRLVRVITVIDGGLFTIVDGCWSAFTRGCNRVGI